MITTWACFIWNQITTWIADHCMDRTWKYIQKKISSTKAKPILVVGPGGVGKSTLGHLLSGNNIALHSGSYNESIDNEILTMLSSKIEIIILPGQKHRRETNWPTHLQGISSGEYSGIIIITSYGHHTMGDISYTQHRLYNTSMNLDSFFANYLQEGIAIEDDIFHRISDAIKMCTTPIWLLNVITKEDLWWEDRKQVLDHYNSDKYKTWIENCYGSKDKQSFRHETVMVSLIIRNLTTGRNELIKKSSAGYDTPQQKKSLHKLQKMLNGLLSWGNNHDK